MLKLSRFLPSRWRVARNEQARNFLLRKATKIKDTFWLSAFSSQHGISTSGPDLVANGNFSGRRFAQYTIFKGKAALSVSPKLPSFCIMDSGSSRVDRKGGVMLTFWPAVGQRKYDWQKKQVFALSPTEVGSLISLGPDESCEFLHDPSMKSSLEGQVKKSLSVTPLGNSSGYFLNLNVVNTVQKTNERFSLPVTKAEFAVMRTALSYVLPHIMGWDQVIGPRLPNIPQNTPRQRREVLPDPDFEWGR
ncbi:single-stranded DNA-binding protein WHY2, mitochondrial isoform X2 [Phoenix dactylifera]|uniref:Single-stranded DNA-binding protein WHY2, mitochondrial isoform X2 n=1 Tax=Phoenix dactylifera TaxID=42345 RepID=A0A8B7MUP4_PHODC|nr:single-stranded DNA-binding protein WHY2, mitochondrial isoform X2 [Phoenix dactylifera]